MGDKEVNVSYERFVVGYAVFYTVYVVLLLLLIGYYTPRDPWIYFFVVQSSAMTLAIIVDHLAPNFVAGTTHAPIFLVVRPLLMALLATHLIGLGVVTKHYGDSKVMFDWVFIVLCVMQVALFASIGMIRVNIGGGRSATTTTAARFNFEIPILTRFAGDLDAVRKRVMFERDM